MRQRGRVDRKAIDGSNACKTSKFVVFSSLLSRACATCQTRAPRSRSLRTRLLLFNDIPSESITAGERRERPSFLRVEKWFRSDFFSRGQSRGKIFVRSSSSFSQPRPPLFLSLFSPFSLLPMLAPLLGLLQFSVRREMGMVVHSFFFFESFGSSHLLLAREKSRASFKPWNGVVIASLTCLIFSGDSSCAARAKITMGRFVNVSLKTTAQSNAY